LKTETAMALTMWVDCPRQGRVLRGFLPHKVPLDEGTSEAIGLDEGDRFTPTMLIERQIHAKAPLGLAISLLCAPPAAPAAPGAGGRGGGADAWASTAAEWEDWDVEFAAVPCAMPLSLDATRARASGVSEPLPAPPLVEQFVRRCAAFWAVGPEGEAGGNAYRCIAVHCNTGFNLTGYMICHFLIASARVAAQDALGAFALARPPGVYDRALIEALFRFHRQVRASRGRRPRQPRPPAPSRVAQALSLPARAPLALLRCCPLHLLPVAQAVPRVESLGAVRASAAVWTPPEAWPAWHQALRDEDANASASGGAPCAAASAQPSAAAGSAPSVGGGAAGKAPMGAGACRPPVPVFAQPAASQPPPSQGGGGAGAALAAAAAGGRAEAAAAGAAGKRARVDEGAAGGSAPPLRMCFAHPPTSSSDGGGGDGGVRPFGLAVGGGSRHRVRRIACGLVGLPPPADTPPPAPAAAAPAAEPPPVAAGPAAAAPLGFRWAEPSVLTSRALGDDFGAEGAAAEWLAAVEPRAPPGCRCVLLWLEGKAYALFETAVDAHSAQPAPARGGGAGAAAPAAARGDVWLLAGLRLEALPDRSLLAATLAPPVGAARRWRLCVRELLACNGQSLCAEPLERRLALLARHVTQPRKALGAQALQAEAVVVLAVDAYKSRRAMVPRARARILPPCRRARAQAARAARRSPLASAAPPPPRALRARRLRAASRARARRPAQYALDQLRRELSVQFAPGPLVLQRKAAPYPLGAGADAGARTHAYAWEPPGAQAGAAAAGEEQAPEAELRACEWLQQ
jgi:hypothetical protein